MSDQKAELKASRMNWQNLSVDLSKPEEAPYQRRLPDNVRYEMVREDDISMKALDRAVSSYTTEELLNLPMNIRKRYYILVNSNVSKEELTEILTQVIKTKTLENPDIDEILVYASDRKEDFESGGDGTYGSAEWSPNGNWGGITTKIASTDDRSSYKYTFNIKDKVGIINDPDKPTENELIICDIYNKRWYELFMDPSFDGDLDIENEKLIENIAEELKIDKNELKKIIDKVDSYSSK